MKADHLLPLLTSPTPAMRYTAVRHLLSVISAAFPKEDAAFVWLCNWRWGRLWREHLGGPPVIVVSKLTDEGLAQGAERGDWQAAAALLQRHAPNEVAA